MNLSKHYEELGLRTCRCKRKTFSTYPAALQRRSTTPFDRGCFRSRNESRGMAGGAITSVWKLTCSPCLFRLRDMRLFPLLQPYEANPAWEDRPARRIPYFARVFPNPLPETSGSSSLLVCVGLLAGIGTFPYPGARIPYERFRRDSRTKWGLLEPSIRSTPPRRFRIFLTGRRDPHTGKDHGSATPSASAWWQRSRLVPPGRYAVFA